MTSGRIELSSPLAAATIVPEEGGRIQHLVDRASGRELLLQRTPGPGPRDDFLNSCAGGWDELFPNDSAWGEYPDHGRLWTLPFQVMSSRQASLEMAAETPSPSARITRRISLLEAPRRGIRSVVTLSPLAATGPFLWAAHPMLGVAEGWVVELPAGASAFEADSDLPGRFGSGRKLDRSEWEEASRIPPVRSGVSELVYVDGVGEAIAHSPDGRAITRVSWDPAFLKHLWIVIITGAYGLDDCLILEPCTTRPYPLQDAIRAGSALELAAGTNVTWWVEIESLDG